MEQEQKTFLKGNTAFFKFQGKNSRQLMLKIKCAYYAMVTRSVFYTLYDTGCLALFYCCENFIETETMQPTFFYGLYILGNLSLPCTV